MPGKRESRNTESVDNYLKAILMLSGPQEQRVTIMSLAGHLGVAPASVTNMLQKLSEAESPLVFYERHRGVMLSASGKRRALEIVRHHRLIETFLFEVLDYPIEEVHDEAERLEHFISERFEERIAAKLGHPKIDPHGHSIPTIEGELAASVAISLADVEQNGMFLIDSISDRDSERLKRMEASGIVPGQTLQVRLGFGPTALSVRVGKAREFQPVSLELAQDVRIVRLLGESFDKNTEPA